MSKRSKRKRNRKRKQMDYYNILRGKNIYVVGGAKNYANWLFEMEFVDNVDDADLVMFTGGADVNPELYGEKKGKYTHVNIERDIEEVAIFKEAIEKGKKIIGICRGSQLTCVMAGGKLVQHCVGHGIAGEHNIRWANNETSDITSTHHQMQYPFNLPKEDYIMCAYSTAKRSNTYLNGDNEEIDIPKDFVEPEVVVYRKIDAIAIQGHPEHLDRFNPGVRRIKEVVKSFFAKDFKHKKEEVTA